MERSDDEDTERTIPSTETATARTKSPLIVSLDDDDEAHGDPPVPKRRLPRGAVPAASQHRPLTTSNFSATPKGGFTLPAPEATSDLLSRIGSFLPKIRAANQELLLEEADEEAGDGDCHDSSCDMDKVSGNRKRKMTNRRIDACLEPDNSVSSSSSSASSRSQSSSSSSTNGGDDNSESSASEHVGDDEDAAHPQEHASSTLDKKKKSRKTENGRAQRRAASPSEAGPIIEIHLALGAVEDNPIINLLADAENDQDSDNADASSEREEEDPPDPTKEAVRRLLDGPKHSSSPRATVKGPLITELH
jgi:hypothetical protein